MFVFYHTFPVLWKSTFPMFWELHGFLLHPKYLRNPWIWNVCALPYVSRAMEIHFPYVLGIAWISASPKKCLRNPWIWNVCIFPCFSDTIEIHFPHVLGMVWISASPKIFEKLITLECLCFPRLFQYYGNPLSSCFGNCMDFCFTRNI